ncbi:hypothetical protein F5051DRAFT_429158 [Lentinula edodes]|nr:hypothetical protein F5051DRAFT_429158 [Lentinula edodes]
MYTRQSKDTSWRALSSDESTQSKNQSLLWVLSLLGSAPKCSELLSARLGKGCRYVRCLISAITSEMAKWHPKSNWRVERETPVKQQNLYNSAVVRKCQECNE